MNMIMTTKLKSERKKRGMSQQTLAYKAKVHASDVSRFETCQAIPYPDQAKRLARVLGLQPEELQQPATDATETVSA